MERLVPHLATHHRVHTYDRRGHGRSTCPRGQGHISEDVADLAGLIRALGLDAPPVVGHSYGSSTPLLLGTHHPELGPGTWDGLFTPTIRQICIGNAGTWLDRSRDPERLAVRPELLAERRPSTGPAGTACGPDR